MGTRLHSADRLRPVEDCYDFIHARAGCQAQDDECYCCMLQSRTWAALLNDVPASINTTAATKTEFWRQMPAEVRESIFKMFPMKTQSQGAATPLITALDPSLPSGAYLDDSQVQDVAGHASNADTSRALWDSSEKLTGKTFNW
jgi:hypothetical protein